MGLPDFWRSIIFATGKLANIDVAVKESGFFASDSAVFRITQYVVR